MACISAVRINVMCCNAANNHVVAGLGFLHFLNVSVTMTARIYLTLRNWSCLSKLTPSRLKRQPTDLEHNIPVAIQLHYDGELIANI